MKTNPSEGTRTAELGDVVVAIFDEAACHSSDADEIARLATEAVEHVLRRSMWASAHGAYQSRENVRAGASAVAEPSDGVLGRMHQMWSKSHG